MFYDVHLLFITCAQIDPKEGMNGQKISIFQNPWEKIDKRAKTKN